MSLLYTPLGSNSSQVLIQTFRKLKKYKTKKSEHHIDKCFLDFPEEAR